MALKNAIIVRNDNGTETSIQIDSSATTNNVPMTLNSSGLSVTGTLTVNGATVTPIGQTPTAVTRNGGTTYTNTTGKVIIGYMAQTASGAGTDSLKIAINGGDAMMFATANYSSTTNRNDCAGTYMVPVGATYVFTIANGSGSITTYEYL